jgi:type I restriction enzyme M protein
VLADAVGLIDQLFARVGDGSAAQDIMGDTFEYLLDEVATAGKNGQFRTPRHLIRFMVELLDPEPSQRVIDPAAGTGGFLFSVQQYLMRKFTTQENLVLEWDGTPHRLDGAKATPKEYAAIHNGGNFVGLDNDRTMARIGWMNLILHDVSDPHLLQGDSLSKREGKSKQLADLLASESYDFVLANPPFTGTVDTNDLEKDSLLFPRAADKGKKKDDVLTNKSELLFLWLMLDLLDVGGACAVIIPEGVLFGNTDAHVRLRRELLTEHVVEAVISLPGGMFQPYTGVKTSVLIFRKETRRDAKQLFKGQAPQTEYVWFYEVEEDGFSRDAKRSPRPGQRNDLWDALVKFKAWQMQGREGSKRLEKTYFQPSFHPERWRQALLRDTADQLTPAGEAFSSLPDIRMWDGKIWNIHELFDELPANPKEAEAIIRGQASTRLLELAIQQFTPVAKQLWETYRHSGKDAGIQAKDGNLQIPASLDSSPETTPSLPSLDAGFRPPSRNDEQEDEALLAQWRKTTKPLEAEFNRIARELQKFFEMVCATQCVYLNISKIPNMAYLKRWKNRVLMLCYG